MTIKKMTIEEIKTEVKVINNYLKNYTQMDFEVPSIGGNAIKILGKDASSENTCAIKIIFEFPFCIDGSLKFSLDTSKPFIELMEDEEKIEVIQKFHLEIGYHPFKLNVKQLKNGPVVIASENLKHEII